MQGGRCKQADEIEGHKDPANENAAKTNFVLCAFYHDPTDVSPPDDYLLVAGRTRNTLPTCVPRKKASSWLMRADFSCCERSRLRCIYRMAAAFCGDVFSGGISSGWDAYTPGL